MYIDVCSMELFKTTTQVFTSHSVYKVIHILHIYINHQLPTQYFSKTILNILTSKESTMKAAFITSLLAFASTALAAPAPINATPTLITREATQVERRSPTTTIQPGLQGLWQSKNPAAFGSNTPRGHVLNNPTEQVNTVVYFNLTPEQARGKTCKLNFHLSIDDWAVTPTPGAPAAFDIYRLEACVNDKYSWGNRVPRGASIGTLYPVKGGETVWQHVDMSEDKTLPYMGAAPTFTCQAGEYSFELVAHPGSNIGWTSGRGSGLTLELCG
jgi:hypothetical protein